MSAAFDAAALRDRLARFPAALRALVSMASGTDVLWSPSDDNWSILEVCCHLLDEEREDFRTRMALTLQDPRVPWPRLDLESVSQRRRYRERDLAATLDAFDAERAQSIAWLDSIIASADFTLAQSHPRYGPLHAGMLLASWAAHDALHIRQVARRLHELAARDGGPYAVTYAGEW